MSTEATRALRQCRASLGLCIDCGDEPPKGGLVRCEACNEKNNERTLVAAHRRKKALAKSGKNATPLRAKRLAKGLCSECGKAPVEKDRVRCRPCAERNRENTLAAKREQRICLKEQQEFEKAQRLAWEARICEVQRKEPDLTREQLAERFSTTINVISHLARKYGLNLRATEAAWDLAG